MVDCPEIAGTRCETPCLLSGPAIIRDDVPKTCAAMVEVTTNRGVAERRRAGALSLRCATAPRMCQTIPGVLQQHTACSRAGEDSRREEQ